MFIFGFKESPNTSVLFNAVCYFYGSMQKLTVHNVRDDQNI